MKKKKYSAFRAVEDKTNKTKIGYKFRTNMGFNESVQRDILDKNLCK